MKRKKSFNTVKRMREIRDKLSQEFKHMSYEEQKKYIKKRIKPGGIVPQESKKKIRAA